MILKQRISVFFFALLAAIFLCVSFSIANADPLGDDWEKNIEDVPGFVQPGGGDFAEEVQRLFYNNLLPTFKYLFAFVAILIWIIYVATILFASGNEETISEQRKNLGWGVMGMLLVSMAVSLGDVFTPLNNAQDIIDQQGAQTQFQKIIAFLQMSITIISVATIFYAGFLFVRSQGEEEKIDESKKYLTWSTIGIIIAMIAEPLVNNVFYPADQTPGAEEIANLAEETGGLLRFFLAFLGVGATATLVIAGFYYITSFGDDERQEKAKNIIIGTATGIVVILSAYVIVTLFVPS